MRVTALVALVAAALSAERAAAATTCPVQIQSQALSTLTDPIVVSSAAGSSSSTSGSSSGKKNNNSTGSSSESGSAGASGADVGSDGSNTGGSTDGTSGSVGGSGSAGVTNSPTSTTATPTSTTKTPSSTTATPTSTTKTPSSTTAAPTTSSGSSSSGGSDMAGNSRRLQTTVIGNVNVGTATTAPTSTTTAPTSTTSTPTSTSTPTPSTGGTSSSSGSASVGDNTSSDSGSGSSTSDVMSCDSTFYSQWDTLGLKCGGSSLDVDSAVSASSCVIYSGTVGSISGSTCVSICSFPACTNGAWDYSASNGLSSSVYSGLELDSFMNTTIITALEERSSAVSTFLSNSTMTSDEQCSYSSEDSFSSCTCSATIVSSSSYDSAKKQERENDEADGVITEDSTTDTGTIVASTSKSVAGVTVVVSGIAAVASTIASSTSTATASLTMAGSTAVTTVELCQFAVFVNMLDLDGKSSALSLFGKQMAPANFMFLPFGKLDDDDDSDGSSSGSDSTSGSGTRRRLSSDSGSSGSSGTSSGLSGMAKYARMIGIKEDMLFIVTLAGVICVMAGVVALFGLGYLIAGLFMPREEFLTKFFDKMIGLEILVAILSQYTLGVTGTYQIYYSFSNDDPTDPKCILAIVALLFLACGIILYGYIVVKKHEAEIADVGTVQHLKKTVNMRYGPFYEEYKYKNRFFFTIKLMVALATGVVTGFVGISSTVQVGIVLAINVFFFFYLEIQSPHHSRFVQTATSFVSIMKIAVLVLTFFLISAATSDGFPTSLQNGISLAIVGLNLFALVLLMIRSLYMFWKKYQLQREARFDEEEQTAQDYFKDETPQQRKDRELTNSSHQAGVNLQSQQSTNPYVQGNQNYDYEGGDEIRLRSGTHMQEQAEEVSYNQQHTQVYDVNRNTATNYYANDRASAAQRRNDVVEL